MPNTDAHRRQVTGTIASPRRVACRRCRLFRSMSPVCRLPALAIGAMDRRRVGCDFAGHLNVEAAACALRAVFDTGKQRLPWAKRRGTFVDERLRKRQATSRGAATADTVAGISASFNAPADLTADLWTSLCPMPVRIVVAMVTSASASRAPGR